MLCRSCTASNIRRTSKERDLSSTHFFTFVIWINSEWENGERHTKLTGSVRRLRYKFNTFEIQRTKQHHTSLIIEILFLLSPLCPVRTQNTLRFCLFDLNAHKREIFYFYFHLFTWFCMQKTFRWNCKNYCVDNSHIVYQLVVAKTEVNLVQDKTTNGENKNDENIFS